MHWLFGWKRLKALGVIGLNARNAGAIMGYNPRMAFPLVDDKIVFAQMCQRVGIPTPQTRAILQNHGDSRFLAASLDACADVVVKPARGSGGRGVLVLLGHHQTQQRQYRRAGGRVISYPQLEQHVSDCLSGLHSLGDQPDAVILQERIDLHPMFHDLAEAGTPDVRVVVFREQPVMAMLRLPTRESAGRANLHQGGLGVGIDLRTGTTTTAIWRDQLIDRHPDTQAIIAGRTIADWPSLLHMAQRAARVTGLGYLGVDVIMDPERGPMILEANARPGLAIQLANQQGLQQAIEQFGGLG